MYRKKPVTVEAFQIPALFDIDGRLEFEDWSANNNIADKLRWSGSGMKIQSLEGEMLAKEGDFVIIGIKGEVYSCDQEIFHGSYHEWDPLHGFRDIDA